MIICNKYDCYHKYPHEEFVDFCYMKEFCDTINRMVVCVDYFPYLMKKVVSNERKNSSRIVRGDEESVSDKA